MIVLVTIGILSLVLAAIQIPGLPHTMNVIALIVASWASGWCFGLAWTIKRR